MRVGGYEAGERGGGSRTLSSVGSGEGRERAPPLSRDEKRSREKGAPGTDDEPTARPELTGPRVPDRDAEVLRFIRRGRRATLRMLLRQGERPGQTLAGRPAGRPGERVGAVPLATGQASAPAMSSLLRRTLAAAGTQIAKPDVLLLREAAEAGERRFRRPVAHASERFDQSRRPRHRDARIACLSGSPDGARRRDRSGQRRRSQPGRQVGF
jgi:hypothetical protein